MRILLVDVVCKSGSTGKIVYDIYSQLNGMSNVAAICYGRGKKNAERGIIKISSNIEMYLHAILTRITGLTGYYSWFSTRKLIRFIKKFKPDVVHIHDPKTYYLNIIELIRYLKKNNIPIVWTLHSEFMYTGKCGYSYECEQWKKGCGNCPMLKEYPKSLFFDFTRIMLHDKQKAMSDLDKIFFTAPSYWLANRAKQTYMSKYPFFVVRNGIDTNGIFHRQDYDKLKEKHNIGNRRVILSVAPDIMCERKGGHYVLELAKLLRERPYIFILIGASSASMTYDDNVIVLARTENQVELAQYYSMADVFVICSKRENFPTTCIESMCCGTPVLGFDTGGTKETAPEGYGLFVPYGDVDTLANNIDSVLNGDIEIKSKAQCEEYGKKNYDKSVMCDQYISLYKRLLYNTVEEAERYEKKEQS